MAMEVAKPWEFKEEVDIMEEEEEDDDAGALHTRNRKNSAADGHGNGESNAAEEGGHLLPKDDKEPEEEEQNQSVFLDSTNDNATESNSEQEVTKVGQSNRGKEDDNESAEERELEKQENFGGQENNKNERNNNFENGLHSNGVQKASISSEATAEAGPRLVTTIGESSNSLADRSGALDISNSIANRTQVHEIEVEKDENVTKGKVNVEEYDLEKILDEQETHDLYCPNCKSCITRRVILKKRKRTVKQALRDEPPKKTQIAGPSADTSHQTANEQHDQDAPEVFKCLSCLTFFIPRGGFNIFRIFERKDMNQQVDVQHPSASRHSENCGSWLLSCFQTVDSPKNSTDAAKDPLLSGSQNSSDQISSTDDNTGSAHIHATNGKTDQPKNTSSAGSSSMAQTSAKKKEDIEHGTTSSSGTTDTSSSSTASTISPSHSKPGFMQAGTRGTVPGQQDVEQQEQIPLPLSQSDGNGLTDGIHPQKRDPFFDQNFFGPGLKLPGVLPPKVLPGVDNLLSQQKPTPPVQSDPQPQLSVRIPDDEPPARVPASAQRDEWDVLKAIVYGGLAESITSLSVVSAAAASGAKTLDIFILGIANLIGGLPVILHNIADLRYLGAGNEDDERVGHYWLQLGRRSKYRLHMVMAVLSYILFGLLPPVVYGLSFRKSDDRENKMMVVAAASLACVALLAIGKAHVKRPRAYFTTVLYYLSIGLSGSGLSYVAGVLITRLLAHFGLIDGGATPSAAPAPPGLLLPDAMGATATAWASY